MPVSDNLETTDCDGETDAVAVAAEVLFLLNLLLLPVVAFLIMTAWYFFHSSGLSSVAASHFRQ